MKKEVARQTRENDEFLSQKNEEIKQLRNQFSQKWLKDANMSTFGAYLWCIKESLDAGRPEQAGIIAKSLGRYCDETGENLEKYLAWLPESERKEAELVYVKSIFV